MRNKSRFSNLSLNVGEIKMQRAMDLEECGI
jgi:hypothetical protein